MQLEEAHRRGLVSIEIVGSGGSSGDVISVVVQRRVKRVLRLTLGAGTVLKSASPKIQNMVVATIKGLSVGDKKYRPTKVMELSDDASHTYLFGTDAQFSMDGSFNQDGSQASGSWRLRVGIGNTCRGGWVATAPGQR